MQEHDDPISVCRLFEKISKSGNHTKRKRRAAALLGLSIGEGKQLRIALKA